MSTPTIPVRGEIKLGQFIKLASLAEDGAQARELIQGGDVTVNQYNFSGIGAVGGGAKGASFPDVRTGIRAQVQHLRAYADSSVTTASLANTVVDPRFTYVRKGAAPVVEYLGIQENPNRTGWAAAKNYGYDLVSMMKTYF